MIANGFSRLIPLLALLSAPTLAAQSRAAGARELLPSQQAVGSVGYSQAVWAKPNHFWFRKSVPGGNVWITVDAQHGVKEPLFDHQRLAIELNLRTGFDYTPLTLPIADSRAQFVVKYDGSNAYIQEGAMAIEFIHGENHWRCDLQIKWDWNKVPPTDYQCLPGNPVTPASASTPAIPGSTAVLSPNGRWLALVFNDNVVVFSTAETNRRDGGPVTTDGTRDFAYQTGSIQWSADSQTLSAYRVSAKVWESESLAGNVKELVVRGEWKVPGK